MTATQTTPDFADLIRRARKMTDAALQYSADDASGAADMAEKLELAGCRVQKSGGYYRDEAGIYRTELRRRSA